MKAYIATAIENHKQHNELAIMLNEIGFELTYDWTVHGSIVHQGLEVMTEYALLEKAGVCEADLVIVLLPGGRGTHVELGMALAMDIPVIIYSPEESAFSFTKATCLFYFDPRVLRISGTLQDIIDVLQERIEEESMKSGMINGSIVRKFSDKGFGFIHSEGKEYFFHCSQVTTPFENLEVNDSVYFEIEDSPKGKRAVRVEKIK